MITGFSSPAAGYEDNHLDLNSLLIKHPNATSLMQVESNHYRNMGIYPNDILIIDRALTVKNDSLVVYEEDGKFVLGRVFNIKHETIIAGVIVHVIHTVRGIL